MKLSNVSAYFLAQRKYDVFLYNPRGNKYSRGHRDHRRFDSSKPYGPYWAFSWYEMGFYDLPAVINEILSITKKDKVSAVGHSQGNINLKCIRCMSTYKFSFYVQYLCGEI